VEHASKDDALAAPAARKDPAEGGDTVAALTRQAIRYELDRLCENQRLTPAQRRIAQCLVERSSEVGYLSSIDLSKLANVSQPSVTRFAMALGFDGYMELRKHLGARINDADTPLAREGNRYQLAALSDSRKLAELSETLADRDRIDRIGTMLAGSRPLPVLGLRASCGLSAQFCYFAAKVHPDIRSLESGGSIIGDHLEQARRAGASALLAFMMPLYPKETVEALKFAKKLGLSLVVVTDAKYSAFLDVADEVLHAPITSNL
jgi:DNA-binding MurR/RpiR family transcriptional regulator